MTRVLVGVVGVCLSLLPQGAGLPLPGPGRQVLLREGLVGDVVDVYWLYLPESHATDRKWPIILFLQGGAGVGGSPESCRLIGPVRHVFEDRSADLDPYVRDTFIIANPHMRDGPYWERQWYQQDEALSSLLDHLVDRYAGNPDRIYVTGLSRGGNGTWGLGQRLRPRIAAIQPICGQLHGIDDFGALAGLPVWVVHGTNDHIHDHADSVRAVETLERLGGEPFLRLSTVWPRDEDVLAHRRIFSSIPNGPHDVWSMTYASPQIYRWLLRFRSDGSTDSRGR